MYRKGSKTQLKFMNRNFSNIICKSHTQYIYKSHDCVLRYFRKFIIQLKVIIIWTVVCPSHRNSVKD